MIVNFVAFRNRIELDDDFRSNPFGPSLMRLFYLTNKCDEAIKYYTDPVSV